MLKIDEWWEAIARKQEVKARRPPGTTCHREKWERRSSGIRAKDALSCQGDGFRLLHHSCVLVVA